MLTLHPALQPKYAALQQQLRDWGRVIVAFSGGVDSTLLLKVAVETLGPEQVLAVIGDSESYPARELAEAKQLAEGMGARYRVIPCQELDDARYAANPKNRCYYCKSELFARITAIARNEDYAVVLDGNNADDIGDWRPGRQAAREYGVQSPLILANLTKDEVRELSRAFALPTWDKPSFACLASRIPYGTQIDRALLGTIEQAENFLRDLGFAQVRVRHHGEVARIEVESNSVPRLLDPALRDTISEKLKALGYHYVTVDLQGYRTGSMNAALIAEQTPR